MQFTFGKDDGVYTIYKSIQKCSRVHSVIHLTIDDNNALFEHDWRGQQIQTICAEKGIDLQCIATGPISTRYYKRLGMSYTVADELRKREKRWRRSRRSRRRFHTKTTYHTFLLLVIEIVGLFFLLRMVMLLLFPSATIVITPHTYLDERVYNFGIYPAGSSYASTMMEERLNAPYYTGTIQQTLTARRAIMQQITSQSPAVGTITITNNGNTTFAGLVPQTQWITDSGIIYRTTQRVGPISPGGVTTVGVYAVLEDAQGQPVGDNANIVAETPLSIRNLPETKGIIVGVARDDFVNGSLVREGRVTQDDIDALYATLSGQIEEIARSSAQTAFPDDHIVIPQLTDMGTGMYAIDVVAYSISHNINDKTTSLHGEMTVDITYPYLRRADMSTLIKEYLADRRSRHTSLLRINYDRLQIIEVLPITSSIYRVSTSFSMMMGYNFDDDVNHLIPSIKDEIHGLSLDEAYNIIYANDRVKDVTITTHPVRYSAIPNLKSRIFVTINES